MQAHALEEIKPKTRKSDAPHKRLWKRTSEGPKLAKCTEGGGDPLAQQSQSKVLCACIIFIFHLTCCRGYREQFDTHFSFSSFNL